MTSTSFRVWASSCSHVGHDLPFGRESLAEAIRQSEFGGEDGGPPFEWDIALHLGDFAGNPAPPNDEEGAEVVRQFGALRKHRREDVYTVVGNHDASGADEPCQWWFRKWIDPTGENTAYSGVDRSRMRYPVEGSWERYAFRVGNLLFLLMGDRNDGGPPVGRGPSGGYPAGAVTGETFAWWREMVEANQESIIVSAHHHMLKETTVASGPWEGHRQDEDGNWQTRYHRYFADGGPEGSSYLYFVDGQPDAQAFERHLAAHEGAIDLWLGGHTHTHPDDTFGGRSHVERKWGATFVNVAAMLRKFDPRGNPPTSGLYPFIKGSPNFPKSRLFTFTEGSDEVRIQCYLHTSDYAPQGWYAPAERVARLSKPFRCQPP